MILADYLEPLAYDIAFWSLGQVSPDVRAQDQGPLSVELVRKLRAAAIIVLLTKADVDGYCHNLIRAARVRERYLELVRKDGLVDDHHFCAGRIEGFLAACAAEDFALARTIASLSPGAWRSGHEYEDDFCYAQALFNLLAPQRDGVALAAICARWKGALKGAPGNRLAVIEALRSNDASAFEASFEGLLDERAERISADIARGQLEEAPVIADRLVYVEGLALLRIARRLGFPLQPDYRYCPSLAMQAMVKPFPGE